MASGTDTISHQQTIAFLELLTHSGSSARQSHSSGSSGMMKEALGRSIE
jgi:hypothetical protein